MKKILFNLPILFFLTACSSLGHKFEGLQIPNKNEAIIYYYRPSKFVGGGVYYDIKENGEKITTLYNGGYYPHKTTAGEKFISAKTEATEQISFPVENGETYFVRGKVNMGIVLGRPSLKLVPKEKALKEIQNCRIIEEEN